MTSTMPSEGLLAVYDRPNAPFELRMFPIREPEPGEVLVKIRMCTICRSDIHSYLGHRPNPTPGVLGHEIIGTIVSLGDGVTKDMRGDPLRPGDRITWSEYFIPGDNYYTEVLDLPQKSPGWTSTVTWRSRPRRIITAVLVSTATSCRAPGSCACLTSCPMRKPPP